MQAFIKSAGIGTRLRPFTHFAPKPQLKIHHNETLISLLIKQLAQAGIEDIIINVGYLGQMIINALGNGKSFGVRIRYAREPALPIGTAKGVRNALPLLDPAPFLLVNADLYTHFPYHTLLNKTPQWGHLVMVDNPSYHPQGDFCLEQNQIRLHGSNPLTYAGIAVMHPRLYTHTAPLIKEEGDLLRQVLAADQFLSGEKFDGTWINVGTPQDLYRARQLAQCPLTQTEGSFT